MGKLEWKKVDRDFVSKYGDFIFRLHYGVAGVYCMGRAYYLQVRKKGETEFKPLGYSFWVFTDGGYESHSKESVEGKLWSMDRIPDKAEEILESLGYID